MNIVRATRDHRIYRCVTLPNNVNSVMIFDPKLVTSKIAVSVGTGSYNDKKYNCYGLAHFVEHTILMGSKKYPDENYLGDFLSSNNGWYTASTSDNYTIYEFSIRNEKFDQLCDYITDLLTNPLFNPDSIAREIDSVQSEFENAKNNEYAQLEDINSVIFSKDHEFSNFTFGNRKSIFKDRKISEVREDIVAYHKECYSSNLINIVTYSSICLKTVEKIINNYFTTLPNREARCLAVHSKFKTKMYNKLIRMVPLVSVDKMFVRWIIPRYDKIFNMANFFKDIFDAENQGSLCTVLCNTGNISNLCAEINTMCNYFEFSLEFDLNSACNDTIKYIIGALFKYIEYLSTVPINSINNLYDHLRELKSAKFNNIIGTLDPAEFVVNIQTHGENCMLTDNYNYNFEYDTFTKFLQNMTHENMNIVCMSQSYHKFCNMTAPYFNIKFTVDDLPYHNTRMKIHFSLPCIDKQFVSTDFRLKPCGHKRQYPTIIDEESCVWFRQDYTAKIPVVHICALLELGHNIKDTAFAHVLIHGFVTENNVFFDKLRTQTCDTSINIINGYICLNLTCYSDKVEDVWKALLEKFSKFRFNKDGFESAKEMTVREFTEQLEHSQCDQIVNLANVIFGIEKFSKILVRDCIENMSYHNATIKAKGIKILIQGNIYKSEALGLCNIVKRTIKSDDEHTQSTIIPVLGKRYYIKTKQNTNCIGLIVMTGHNPAITSFLNKYIENRFFDELRNRQQLGYIVFSQVIENSAQTGILFSIQSEKYNPEELFQKVITFLNTANMDHAAISDMIHSSTNCGFESLADEYDHNLKEIRRRTLMFNRNESNHSVIKSLFSRKVISFYKEHFVRNPKFIYIQS